MHFLKSTCMICREVECGEFKHSQHICSKHRQDEIDFVMSLPENPNKEDKAQVRRFEKRWTARAALTEAAALEPQKENGNG
jgi:hypothetical protein